MCYLQMWQFASFIAKLLFISGLPKRALATQMLCSYVLIHIVIPQLKHNPPCPHSISTESHFPSQHTKHRLLAVPQDSPSSVSYRPIECFCCLCSSKRLWGFATQEIPRGAIYMFGRGQVSTERLRFFFFRSGFNFSLLAILSS